MNDKNKEAAAPGVPAAFALPQGLVNANARYATYDSGVDVRDFKKNLGKHGHPIYGRLLGRVSLPATIEDDDGVLKDWIAYVIELSKPCPAEYPDPENPEKIINKNAAVGERILLTETSALLSVKLLQEVLEDTERTFEVAIDPQVGKTKAGRALWLYPTFAIGNPQARKSDQRITFKSAAPVPALGAGPAAANNMAGATRPAFVPGA